MKLLVVACALVLVSCEEARVLSSDGSKYLGYCKADRWVKCVSGLCPQGYDIVVHSTKDGEPTIIKCKEAPDAGAPCKEPR